MKIQNPIFLVSVRFGTVAAGVCMILFTVLYYSGRNPMVIPAFLDFRLLLFPIFLVFGIRDFRENRNNGYLHFWQGFSVGMLIVLIVAVVMGFYIYFLGSLLDPGFTSHYIHTTMDNIVNARDRIIAQVGEKAYRESLRLVPTTTLFDLSLDYFIKSLPPGIILTILISLVLRRNQ